MQTNKKYKIKIENFNCMFYDTKKELQYLKLPKDKKTKGQLTEEISSDVIQEIISEYKGRIPNEYKNKRIEMLDANFISKQIPSNKALKEILNLSNSDEVSLPFPGFNLQIIPYMTYFSIELR